MFGSSVRAGLPSGAALSRRISSAFASKLACNSLVVVVLLVWRSIRDLETASLNDSNNFSLPSTDLRNVRSLPVLFASIRSAEKSRVSLVNDARALSKSGNRFLKIRTWSSINLADSCTALVNSPAPGPSGRSGPYWKLANPSTNSPIPKPAAAPPTAPTPPLAALDPSILVAPLVIALLLVNPAARSEARRPNLNSGRFRSATLASRPRNTR